MGRLKVLHVDLRFGFITHIRPSPLRHSSEVPQQSPLVHPFSPSATTFAYQVQAHMLIHSIRYF